MYARYCRSLLFGRAREAVHDRTGTAKLSTSIGNGSLLDVYKNKVADGTYTYDDKQFVVLRYLSRLCNYINEDGYKPSKLKGEVLKKAQAERVVTTKQIYHHPALRQREMKSEQDDDGGELSEKAVDSEDKSVGSEKLVSENAKPAEEDEEPARIVKGVYVYGEVGTGKTMAMDLFFSSVQTERKRRVHFHQFMLEIHSRIRVRKQELLAKHGRSVNIDLSHQGSERDAIAHVARAVSDEAWLLCFDEFQVTDVADAMILSKFFDTLFDNGTVLVATSNRPPDDLYKNGLNRSYFEPFVNRLKAQSVVRHIDSIIDYRSLVSPTEDSYIIFTEDSTENSKYQAQLRLCRKFIAIGNDDPNYTMNQASRSGNSSEKDLENEKYNKEKNFGFRKRPFSMVVPIMMGRSLIADHAFPKKSKICGNPYEDEYELSLYHTDRFAGEWPSEKKGRKIADREQGNSELEDAGAFRGVGWFTFPFLCEQDRGASDYQALCSQFGTIFIEGIPRLSVLEHDKARRFIVLVDTLYDNNIRVYWSAAAPPDKLFRFLMDDAKKNSEGQRTEKLENASFGTDHKWVRRDYKVDSQWTNERRKVQVPGEIEKGHRRGAEQMAATFQFNNEEVSTSRLSQSDSCVYNYTVASVVGDSSEEAEIKDQTVRDKKIHGVDAVQDELKILEGELASVQELAFAFRRAGSRLTEMAGSRWQERWNEIHDNK